jgi:N-acetyl-D-muramate 6-phosphate phosphatase
MTANAVLFDLDGTLFDTMPDFVFIFNHMRKQRGLSELSDLPSLRRVIAKGNAAMIEKALNLTQSDAHFNNALAEFTEHYLQVRGRYSSLFDGFKEVFAGLEKHHIPWGIVTNRLENNIAPFLKMFALDEHAHCLVGADTVGRGKPDPAPLLHAAKLLAIAPENCFYVGDFSTDIIAAKAAGMKSVAVAWGYHDGLTDMESWQPAYIIHKPAELFNLLNLP